jgi:hypothetical protein
MKGGMQTALIIAALLLLILLVKREGLTPLNDVPMPKTITFKIKAPGQKTPSLFSASYAYTEDALNDVNKYFYGGGMSAPGTPGELTLKFLAASNYLNLRKALNQPNAPMNIKQAWGAAHRGLRNAGYKWSVHFT